MFIQTLLLIIVLLLFDKFAYSVAWLRKEKEFISIHSFSIANQINTNLYSSNNFSSYNITSFDYSVYAEYGATNRITIGTNSILESYTTENNKSGLSIKLAEYFARYGLFYTKDRSVILTAQFLYKIPSLYNYNNTISSVIYTDANQHDIETLIQLLNNKNVGDTFLLFDIQHKQLFNIEFGYRERFNLNFNEVRLNLQYMFWFNNSHAILFGFYKIMRIYNLVALYPFDFLQHISWAKQDQNTGEFNWVFFIKENEAISLGFFVDLYGEPFGFGTNNLNTFGIKIGLWFI